jgi:hypothetical protein
MVDEGRERFVRCVDVVRCAGVMSDCTENIVFGGRCEKRKALRYALAGYLE